MVGLEQKALRYPHSYSRFSKGGTGRGEEVYYA